MWGTLAAIGLSDDSITFENISIYPGNSQTISDLDGLVRIENAHIYNSKLFYPSGDAVYGSLVLRNSYIENIDYMYLWYPVRDSIIEKNVFINPGLLSAGLTGVNLSIRKNLFYKQSQPLVNWAAYSGSKMIVENNSFIKAIDNILALQYDSSSMTAQNNYWGTLSDSEIADRIVDKSDDLALPGFIPYKPILSEPDVETPKLLTHEVRVEGIEGGSVVFDHPPLETSCNGNACSYIYFHGVTVVMTFIPKSNYIFNGWEGDCSTREPCLMRVDTDKNVVASLQAKINYNNLTVTKTGQGYGTVISNPAAINCGSNCSGQFAEGSNVSLIAQPDNGYTFTGWGGACSGIGTCVVTMDSEKSVSATFAPLRVLTVTKTGSGTITSIPAKISCGSACSSQFLDGSTVTLIAQPDYGYAFAGWGGVCSGTGTCAVTMDDDKSVSANFIEMPKYPVKITKPNTGVISSEPAGILCGGPNKLCSAFFSSAKLTATPGLGYEFIRWNGCQSIEGNICYIKPTGKMTVNAVFKKLPRYNLKITKNTLGSVISSPAGLNCPDKKKSCTVKFTKGTEVILSPLPQQGRSFVGWTGACSGADVCSLFIDGNKAVGATFQ